MEKLKYIKPKLFSTMKTYTKEQFVKDIVAGIIVAIIALPLSIALAIASGVNPEQGLYTAIIAGFFISLLGGSRVQIGGPTAAFVVIIYGIIAQYGMPGLTIATFLSGIIMIIMGLCHFGNLIKFIPKTITVGFTFGIAIGIFAGQLKDFFGLSMGAVPSEFVDKCAAYAKAFHTIDWMTFGIGMLALLIQIFWPKVSAKIPGSLIAILVTTLIVQLGKLPVATIGDLYTIKAGFPKFAAPQLSFALVKELISPAFTIAILASIESLLSCVVSDGMIGGHHRSNAELVGQGVGNIMSSLFGGIPATGADRQNRSQCQKRRTYPDCRYRPCDHPAVDPAVPDAVCIYDSDDLSCRNPDYGCLQHERLQDIWPHDQNSTEKRYSRPDHHSASDGILRSGCGYRDRYGHGSIPVHETNVRCR